MFFAWFSDARDSLTQLTGLPTNLIDGGISDLGINYSGKSITALLWSLWIQFLLYWPNKKSQDNYSIDLSCHPTFTDIFLVDTKSTKVGRNSRGFLELSTAVRLGWVWTAVDSSKKLFVRETRTWFQNFVQKVKCAWKSGCTLIFSVCRSKSNDQMLLCKWVLLSV